MADQFLSIFNLGEKGVNVDLNPLELANNQYRKAQNIISDPLGVELGVKNRPGLTHFNGSAANGVILGGTSIPLQNLLTGGHFFFIGRGPTT
jgi:hypothetical protein